MTDTRLEAAIIFDSHLPEALRRALEYAGEDGFVASMPQLLHARAHAPFDNEIWDTWFFTSNSEESMVETPQGNHVAVLVHGGGIFSTPARFRQLYLSSTDRHSEDGFTGLFGGRILNEEAHDILTGRCPNGTEIPVFPYSEFRKGIADLPRRYAVVMDFETARTSKCGLTPFDELKDDPLMIVRAGGAEPAAAYLDKAQEYYGTSVMGSWHRFDDMNPMNPQTWVPFVYDCLGGASNTDETDLPKRTEGMMDIWFTHYRIARDAGFGLRADTAMINTARYVAVAPRSVATGVRHLPFTP
ncbi:MAG: hypothetical protein ACE5FV_10190 [Woeseia sp.]